MCVKCSNEAQRLKTEQATLQAVERKELDLADEVQNDIREGGLTQLATKATGEAPVVAIGVKIRPKRAGFGASKPTPIETSWHENVLILTPMPVVAVAFAVWPEETKGAERALEEIGVRLLTGGFVGASRTAPFGIVAIAGESLALIMLGYLANGTYSLLDKNTVGVNRKGGVYTHLSKVPLKDVRLLHFHLPSHSETGCGARVRFQETTQMELFFPAGAELRKLLTKDHAVGAWTRASLVHPLAGYVGDNSQAAKDLISRLTAAAPARR